MLIMIKMLRILFLKAFRKFILYGTFPDSNTIPEFFKTRKQNSLELKKNHIKEKFIICRKVYISNKNLSLFECYKKHTFKFFRECKNYLCI